MLLTDPYEIEVEITVGDDGKLAPRWTDNLQPLGYQPPYDPWAPEPFGRIEMPRVRSIAPSLYVQELVQFEPMIRGDWMEPGYFYAPYVPMFTMPTLFGEEDPMAVLDGIDVVIDKAELLAALRKNREQHRVVAEEARQGYRAEAERALRAKLDDVVSGKIVPLSFSLVVPVDYTSVYDTAIQMFDMAKATEVKLDAQQFRCVVMDQWDWRGRFLQANMNYSQSARQLYAAEV